MLQVYHCTKQISDLGHQVPSIPDLVLHMGYVYDIYIHYSIVWCILVVHTHTHTAWILYVLVVWFLGLLVAALVIIAVTSSGTIIALLLTGM